MKRRDFLLTSGAVTAGSMISSPLAAMMKKGDRKRVALVGAGVRGTSMWGKKLVDDYSDYLQFVALCDTNPGRLAYAQDYMGINVPVYTDFNQMINKEKIDTIIVTTVDSNHHEFIIKGLQNNIDVVTEKPMTTDETKCQAILEAEEKSKKKVIVAFNYRYAPLFTKIKEVLSQNRVGQITSADFHWYLNTYHGASYFRR
jgi:predicted dehydrogenase